MIYDFNMNNRLTMKDIIIHHQADPAPETKLIYIKSGSLPAHAHRHERHGKVVVN